MSRPLLTALLAAGLLVRVAVLPLRDTTDVIDWKTWTANGARDLGGVVLFYRLGADIPSPARVWSGFDLSVLLALANLGLFAWITRRLATHERGDAAREVVS